MNKKIYLGLLHLAVGATVYAQSPVLSNVTSNPGADLNTVTDDFIQFNLKPTAPVATYVEPYTYTLTATQNGSPVAVTLQSGTPATDVKYFADGFAPGFRLPAGTPGNGDVVLTITPNWGSYAATTTTLTDPGAHVVENTCGTKTVTYRYTSDRQHTDFSDIGASIPKFNAVDGKTLVSADVEVSINVFASNFLENMSTGPQTGFNYRVSLFSSTLDVDGSPVLSLSNEVIYQTPSYPFPSSIPAGVTVPAAGTWTGDSIMSETPLLHSTITRMRETDWLVNAQYVGLDATQDARWVENAAGDTSGALIADMFIVPPTTFSKSIDTTLTTSGTALSQFIGTGSVPLVFNTFTAVSSSGGGGNISGSVVTSGAFEVSVTYNYTEDCMTLSGNVFNDGNGNTDNTVNHTHATGTGLGNPDGVALHANLIDAQGNVIATTTVDATTGAYDFTGLIGSATYTVQISTNPGVLGSAAPATALPADWINTGEQWGTSLDNTAANIDGLKTVTMNGTNATGVNFGINKLSIADDKNYTFTSTPPTGTTIPLDGTNSTYGATPVLLSGMDREDGAMGGTTSKFVIDALPTNGTLLYDGVAVTAAQVASGFEFVNPALLSLQFTGSGYDETVFEYSFIDEAGFKGKTATYTINLSEPLPVSLVSFEAKKNGRKALLTWSTSSERNNKHFSVERSANGNEWEKIGVVNSLAQGGNSNEQLDYLFVDESPMNGINMYQLKQIDIDGRFEYSTTRVLSFDNNGLQIVAYPNPVTSKLTIEGLTGQETIIVYDYAGKKVMTAIATGNKHVIDMASLSDASYSIAVTDGSGNVIATSKVVKRK